MLRRARVRFRWQLPCDWDFEPVEVESERGREGEGEGRRWREREWAGNFREGRFCWRLLFEEETFFFTGWSQQLEKQVLVVRRRRRCSSSSSSTQPWPDGEPTDCVDREREEKKVLAYQLETRDVREKPVLNNLTSLTLEPCLIMPLWTQIIESTQRRIQLRCMVFDINAMIGRWNGNDES